MITLLPGRSAAATTVITVTGLGDSAAPGVSCTPSACPTLRDAVFTANAMTTSSSNPVEIDLPAGTITLTSGILTLGSSTNLFVTVKGHTAGSPSGSVIDQTTASSGVFITPGTSPGAVANFTDLTIEGGHAGGAGGGALQAGAIAQTATGEATTITDCAFLNNTATEGGAIAFSTGGDLTVTNSTFTSNTATHGPGGGIDYFADASHGASSLSISDSTFTSNSANSIVNGAAEGGGVFYSGGGSGVGSLTVTRAVFSGNSAGQSTGDEGQGGGLLVADNNTNPTNDTISLSTFVNNAANDGAATNATPQGLGGGVFANTADLTLSDSRLVGNTATNGPSLWQSTSGVNDATTATDDWWGTNTGPGANAATGGAAASLTTSPWLQLRNLPASSTLLPGGSTTVQADILGRNTGGPLASGTLNGLASFPASGVFSNPVDETLSSTSTQFVNGIATTGVTVGTTLGTDAATDVATADNQTAIDDINVKANSSTSVSTSPSTSAFGQPVTFTATLGSASGATTPPAPVSGTVTFFVDGAGAGTAPASAGNAHVTDAALAVGTHTVTATYSGDADFNASTSAGASQTVNKANTTVAVASSLPTSFAGQGVTFTATLSPVAPGAGTPGGATSVQFQDDGTNLGGPQTPVSGVARLTNANLAVGTHTITAIYAGDANFNGATGTLSPDQVVNPAPTSVTVTSSFDPSAFGQPVTFTATVSAALAGTPAGFVQFEINGNPFGATETLVAGQAVTPPITDLAVGSTDVTATYTPTDGVHSGSSGFFTQTVHQGTTATTLGSSANPSTAGTPVDFTATVTATGLSSATPTGTVQFSIDGSNVGSPQALSGGVATLSGVTSLGIGNHSVVADYLGNPNFTTSTSTTLTEVVNGFATTTTVTSSANPSVFGQPVSFTATVSAGANGTPTGTVQFGVDGANLGAPVALAGGVASSGDLASLAVGTHPVTATYLGAASFGSSSGTLAGGQVVDQAGSTTVVASSPNPSVFGEPVTVTATVTAVAPGAGTPSGSVQFAVGGVDVGAPVGLSGGVATTTVPGLAVGTVNVGATYTGDTNFVGSSADVGQVVSQAATALVAGSSPNPSLVGQGVIFSATVTAVAPGSGTPTGTVSFFVDGTHYGDGALTSGVAQTTVPDTALAVGTHAVTATYSGNTDFAGSSGGLTQTVTTASTTTTVTSSVNPSVFGEAVTFTATVAVVAPGTGTPTGTVEFFADGTSLGSSPLSGAAAVSPAISSLSVGTHSVTATYSGDPNFGGSTGGISQVVGKAATAVTLTAAPDPSVFGEIVTFSATVTAVAPGAGTPTGTVHFSGNGFAFPGVDASVVNGVATATTTEIPVGTSTITANYTGDVDFAASASTADQQVNQAGTTTTVTSSANPAPFGSPVTFTATVVPLAPGAGVPGGQVQFFVDGAAAGGPAGLSGGTAVSVPVSSLATGDHHVTATYSGDANFTASTSAVLTQVVGRVAPVVGVTSTVNPSVFGQPVSFTATVTGTEGVPTGTVQFGVDGANLGAPVTLTAGVATSTDIASLAVGAHTVTATYGGDATYLPGTGTVTQTVDQAASSTTVTSSKNPSVFGESVDFTATIAALAPGAGTPGGQVQFLIDGTDSGGPVSVSGGTASITRAGLSVGNHSVTAQYLGDASFATSSGSLPGGQTVDASPSTTGVTSSKNPSVLGDSVHFTAVVSAGGSGSGMPGGQVQFVVDGSDLGGPVNLSGGSATSGSISSLSVGTHTVEAQYLGDGNFNPSSGTLTGGQVIKPGGTATTVTSSKNPSTVGDTVVFTATVAPTTAAGIPGGTVQFRIDGSDAGSPVALSGGGASYSTDSLTVGNHTVSAVYSGDATYAGSTGTLPGGQDVVAVIDVDLSVQKQGPRQAVVGESTPYVIVVTNKGPHAATGVQVSDTLPAGFSLANTWASQGSCSGSAPKLTCSLGSLAPGAHAYVILVTVPHTAGTATNRARVSGDQTDPVQGNDSASATTRVHRSGYWLFGSDGGVFSFGDAQFYGSTGSMTLNEPVVAMAETPDGLGYWLFASDGGVFAYGDARFFGSVAGRHLNAPIVAMAPTPDGGGYWLFGADGGVFALGDAQFFGSTGNQHLPAPIVGMAISPTGGGYWLVGADGSIYPFGDAQSYGTPSGPGSPIVGMAATRDGAGYWEVDNQGRVYAFGDATDLGSLAGTPLAGPIVGMAATGDTEGYWLVGSDGGVFAFGDAPYLGGMGDRPLNKPITGMAAEG